MTVQIGALTVQDWRDQFPQVGSTYPTRPLEQIDRLIVHHSQIARPADRAGAEQQIAAINQFHTATRGWPRVSYTFCVWDALVWQVNALDLVTYHSGGPDVHPQNGLGDANDHGVGVCILGDFTATQPPDADLRAVSQLFDGLVRQLGRPLALRAHRDESATECPGDWWAPALIVSHGDRRDEILAHLDATWGVTVEVENAVDRLVGELRALKARLAYQRDELVLVKRAAGLE